ncbi:hypothetical protein F4779DRAFT_619120 [Xylariaceae sp. FL0662B]|nr:hypothetical protein F4779DRAFT_619120 [Xylariaceae sp. FL0662B]
MLDESWKRSWARLSNSLSSAERDNDLPSPMPPHDSDSDLGVYDTYAPTPESREPTPLPEDTLERLEFDRRWFRWGEEENQLGGIFLKEALIDAIREKRKRKATDGVRKSCRQYGSFKSKGWTQEQADAANREAEVRGRELVEQLEMMPPPPKPTILMTREETEEKYRVRDATGLSREEQAELVEMFGIPDIRPSNSEWRLRE